MRQTANVYVSVSVLVTLEILVKKVVMWFRFGRW